VFVCETRGGVAQHAGKVMSVPLSPNVSNLLQNSNKIWFDSGKRNSYNWYV
jgi:hypothetical protein